MTNSDATMPEMEAVTATSAQIDEALRILGLEVGTDQTVGGESLGVPGSTFSDDLLSLLDLASSASSAILAMRGPGDEHLQLEYARRANIAVRSESAAADGWSLSVLPGQSIHDDLEFWFSLSPMSLGDLDFSGFELDLSDFTAGGRAPTFSNLQRIEVDDAESLAGRFRRACAEAADHNSVEVVSDGKRATLLWFSNGDGAWLVIWSGGEMAHVDLVPADALDAVVSRHLATLLLE